jgi:hypothetical protein
MTAYFFTLRWSIVVNCLQGVSKNSMVLEKSNQCKTLCNKKIIFLKSYLDPYLGHGLHCWHWQCRHHPQWNLLECIISKIQIQNCRYSLYISKIHMAVERILFFSTQFNSSRKKYDSIFFYITMKHLFTGNTTIIFLKYVPNFIL